MVIAKGPRSGFVEYWFPRAGKTEPSPKLAYITAIPEWEWILGSGVYVDDVDAAVAKAALNYGLISLFVLLVVSVVGYLAARSIVRQLGGEPTAAIEMMSRAASGDLTVEVRSDVKGSMLDSAGKMIGSIRSMVLEITDSSEKLSQGAERIGTMSREVSLAAERQADATSSMAAAIEEMTVSINHISDNAKDTEEKTKDSAELAEEGVGRIRISADEMKGISKTFGLAATKVKSLAEGADRISSIAGVIKDIAGQTNLLALNAAIEAARAGEQGRGFAVVADEVRKLSERTSTATVEIEKMIAGIQTDTEDVVKVMDTALPQVSSGVAASEATAETLERIKGDSRLTLESVRSVADSTKEQSMASNNIAQRVEEIASMVEETSASMRSASDTAAEVERISKELTNLVGRFKC